MVEEEADIEETEATWEDDTQTATNVFLFGKFRINCSFSSFPPNYYYYI